VTRWYERGTDADAVARAFEEGGEPAARDLPADAVEDGAFETQEGYYDALHRATVEAARRRVDDAVDTAERDVINAVRTLETLGENLNEVDERVRDWREETDRVPVEAVVAGREALEDARDETREFIEERAPELAPNLSNLAGPVLAARLIALAGGLDELARMPSGTVQVLGAEDALFRHLRGDAPPPKHGAIYVHPYVRGTREDERGSAARAVAGKLTIAARVDRYAGDLRPELAEELDEKIERIRERGDGGDG
jgi:nucleolar protein 56